MDLSKLPLVLEDMVLEYVTQLDTTEKYDKVVSQLLKTIKHMTNGDMTVLDFKGETRGGSQRSVTYFTRHSYSNTDTLYCNVYGDFHNQNYYETEEYEEFKPQTRGRVVYSGVFGHEDLYRELIGMGDFKNEVGVEIFGESYGDFNDSDYDD